LVFGPSWVPSPLLWDTAKSLATQNLWGLKWDIEDYIREPAYPVCTIGMWCFTLFFC
jgi:hypothetical protein